MGCVYVDRLYVCWLVVCVLIDFVCVDASMCWWAVYVLICCNFVYVVYMLIGCMIVLIGWFC